MSIYARRKIAFLTQHGKEQVGCNTSDRQRKICFSASNPAVPLARLMATGSPIDKRVYRVQIVAFRHRVIVRKRGVVSSVPIHPLR